jgi:hypothetical protein
MYRASHPSHEETIARLERELAEMQGLSGSPRRRMKLLTAVAATSVVSTLLFGAAFTVAQARAERLQRHMNEAAQLLDTRAQDLETCTSVAQEEERAATQCRIEWNELASYAEWPQAKRPYRP